MFFFFSRRRRHTSCSRDWSSDVCSSDLPATPPLHEKHRGRLGRGGDAAQERLTRARARGAGALADKAIDVADTATTENVEIGRASWRERVESAVVGVVLKKKRTERVRDS